jgi:hypothetical protein
MSRRRMTTTMKRDPAPLRDADLAHASGGRIMCGEEAATSPASSD